MKLYQKTDDLTYYSQEEIQETKAALQKALKCQLENTPEGDSPFPERIYCRGGKVFPLCNMYSSDYFPRLSPAAYADLITQLLDLIKCCDKHLNIIIKDGDNLTDAQRNLVVALINERVERLQNTRVNNELLNITPSKYYSIRNGVLYYMEREAITTTDFFETIFDQLTFLRGLL